MLNIFLVMRNSDPELMFLRLSNAAGVFNKKTDVICKTDLLASKTVCANNLKSFLKLPQMQAM